MIERSGGLHESLHRDDGARSESEPDVIVRWDVDIRVDES